MYFRKEQPAPRPEPVKKQSLLTIDGIEVGQSIVWDTGAIPDRLTDAERREICKRLGVKRVNEARCLQIKRCAATMSVNRIVRLFKGRTGFSESTIQKVHAALSAAKGEGAV